ncbi:MAG: hypothetical protein IPM68_08540 [Flavobacteriales bacterium]|nr:hypothetical protein [Flavobacteriales bacterium]
MVATAAISMLLPCTRLAIGHGDAGHAAEHEHRVLRFGDVVAEQPFREPAEHVLGLFVGHDVLHARGIELHAFHLGVDGHVEALHGEVRMLQLVVLRGEELRILQRGLAHLDLLLQALE